MAESDTPTHEKQGALPVTASAGNVGPAHDRTGRRGPELPAEEIVDLVDVHDKVVGNATVGRCLEEGLLHRGVAVQVVRSKGGLVMQQRSRRDRWQPGLWTISSTGHVKGGEDYQAAAHRELREELGIDGPLTSVRKYLMPPLTYRGLTEHEWVSLFTCATDSPVTIDPIELEGVRELTEQELGRMLDGGTFTPDARIILADYLARRSS